mmetsp:Transcript_43967/g.71531  ORF Transcript_43967/g.71531 Transcript_43967/m.71531 type:complete len:216 (-) Transcript_43967:32-679(-)|eukprot:CAMPEP_0184349280 /NCGR_PEP_ID=MMETSP1089-20130417/32286_1 /TAXON_ID=38269 ORGANISM="Gloeochaete wittrockiana, Strain SAG46.84" /NCGR_SAMPLE_ID=MMETSP1089 /ASSEMBLY_ACC=CAM_ASM_000445 /LENGTH=215 /DNA_ID=CAMNT_0026681399 /DNA_START=195 /DNA_END=842 /DNA_ORIENTATION=-
MKSLSCWSWVFPKAEREAEEKPKKRTKAANLCIPFISKFTFSKDKYAPSDKAATPDITATSDKAFLATPDRIATPDMSATPDKAATFDASLPPSPSLTSVSDSSFPGHSSAVSVESLPTPMCDPTKLEIRLIESIASNTEYFTPRDDLTISFGDDELPQLKALSDNAPRVSLADAFKMLWWLWSANNCQRVMRLALYFYEDYRSSRGGKALGPAN